MTVLVIKGRRKETLAPFTCSLAMFDNRDKVWDNVDFLGKGYCRIFPGSLPMLMCRHSSSEALSPFSAPLKRILPLLSDLSPFSDMFPPPLSNPFHSVAKGTSLYRTLLSIDPVGETYSSF